MCAYICICKNKILAFVFAYIWNEYLHFEDPRKRDSQVRGMQRWEMLAEARGLFQGTIISKMCTINNNNTNNSTNNNTINNNINVQDSTHHQQQQQQQTAGLATMQDI